MVKKLTGKKKFNLDFLFSMNDNKMIEVQFLMSDDYIGKNGQAFLWASVTMTTVPYQARTFSHLLRPVSRRRGLEGPPLSMERAEWRIHFGDSLSLRYLHPTPPHPPAPT